MEVISKCSHSDETCTEEECMTCSLNPVIREYQKEAMLAAYSFLQNGNVNSAKQLLITGISGGSVNNCLDIQRANEEWQEKYGKGKAK